MFKIGLIVNPVAGMGGRVGLKGSDGESILQEAQRRGAKKECAEKARRALSFINPQSCMIYTASGEMGEDVCEALSLKTSIIAHPPEKTTAEDTIALAKQLSTYDIDLLVFAGGDGTARNIVTALGSDIPVLGIPTGCKIHSGVYAITPEAAGELIKAMSLGKLMSIKHADVVDLDEEAFRQDKVSVKHYGELKIPAVHEYVQQVKSGGIEDETLVHADIAADITESLDDELLIVGSGTTCAAIMEEMGLKNTLLGVDIVHDGRVIANDCHEKQLLEILERPWNGVKLVITVIGGQGHIFGRGNQQLSPAVIRKIGKENIQIIATRTKLKSLHDLPLIADTGDRELDKHLEGSFQIITGYHDKVIYPLGRV